MENKKSFVLYCDIIKTVEKLPNETAGELFKHLLKYVNDEDPQTENLLVDIAFEPIKQQLKRDLVKWDEIREKRSIAGRKSAEAKKNKKQQSQQVLKVLNKPQQTPTKSTVNDNVTVNVNVNVNDIEYLYKLYPAKCENSNRSTGKCSKNKKQIEKHLKTKTKEELKEIIESYVLDCKNSKTYLKNFSTFLNQLPEVEQIVNFKFNFDADSVYRQLTKKEFDSKYSNHLDKIHIFDKKPEYQTLIR